ncbi:hypothetical protein D3C72_971410 [compost metagenome]
MPAGHGELEPLETGPLGRAENQLRGGGEGDAAIGADRDFLAGIQGCGDRTQIETDLVGRAGGDQ